MNVKRLFLIIFLVYLLGFSTHALFLQKTVYGDGIYYFSWLRSIIVDHSLPPLPNKYSVGPVILWSIPFAWMHSLIRGHGYEFPYQIVAGATSVLLTLFGLALLYRPLTQFFREKPALLTILSIAFATNLFFYGSLDTVNSHGVSFFASIIFLTFLLNRQSLLAGLALGFLGVIRHHDLILGIVALGLLQKKERARFFVAAAIGFLPQLVAWQLLYGSFWNIPYFAGEGFNFLEPHFLEVLFSTKSGLFVYSPIVLLGFVGLLFWKNRLRLFCYLALLLELLVISSWSIWWQGASYGGRMFVASLPLFAFGIASMFKWLLQRIRSTNFVLAAIIVPLSLLNALLIVFFLLRT